MKKSLRYLILAGVLLVSCVQLQAQKYGHINSGNLLSRMNETKVVEAELNSFQKSLEGDLKKMSDALDAKARSFLQKVENEMLTVMQRQNMEKELGDDQAEVQKFAADAEQKIEQKRQELLEPLLDKAQNAIEEVARENSYQLIFDTGIFNAVLMADESIDITRQVLAKLGVN